MSPVTYSLIRYVAVVQPISRAAAWETNERNLAARPTDFPIHPTPRSAARLMASSHIWHAGSCVRVVPQRTRQVTANLYPGGIEVCRQSPDFLISTAYRGSHFFESRHTDGGSMAPPDDEHLSPGSVPCRKWAICRVRKRLQCLRGPSDPGSGTGPCPCHTTSPRRTPDPSSRP